MKRSHDKTKVIGKQQLPKKRKATKTKLIYSNKNISSLVLKNYPELFTVGRSKSIMPIYFTRFNKKQSNSNKLFALDNKLLDLEVRREDSKNSLRIIVFCYRYKGNTLKLDKELKEEIKAKYSFYEVFDEQDVMICPNKSI